MGCSFRLLCRTKDCVVFADSIERDDAHIVYRAEVLRRRAYAERKLLLLHHDPEALHRTLHAGLHLDRQNPVAELYHIIYFRVGGSRLPVARYQSISRFKYMMIFLYFPSKLCVLYHNTPLNVNSPKSKSKEINFASTSNHKDCSCATKSKSKATAIAANHTAIIIFFFSLLLSLFSIIHLGVFERRLVARLFLRGGRRTIAQS